MKFWKRALPFILVNIVVSAAATLLVLYWWSSTHPLNLPVIDNVTTPTPGANPAEVQPTPTLPSLETPVIEINTVIAPGNINNEVVILRLLNDDELLLEGWELKGSGGSVYTFPNLLLKEGEIQLFTGRMPAGRLGSANEIYWERSEAVWRSGETLTLYDPSGNVRATFNIP